MIFDFFETVLNFNPIRKFYRDLLFPQTLIRQTTDGRQTEIFVKSVFSDSMGLET